MYHMIHSSIVTRKYAITETIFLGFKISSKGHIMDQNKLKSISE